MNTKLLNQVAEAILDEPKMFEMSQWVSREPQSPCGTAACIYGHAVAIAKGFSKLPELFAIEGSIRDEGRQLLGLTPRQGRRIVSRFGWSPSEFADATHEAKTTTERAEITFGTSSTSLPRKGKNEPLWTKQS